MHFSVGFDIMVKVFRGVAQVVERYFREVEAASSSLVTPIQKYLIITGFRGYQDFLVSGEFIILYHLLPDFIIQIRVQIGAQRRFTRMTMFIIVISTESIITEKIQR